MAQLERTIVKPARVSPPAGAYSHALRVKARELVFIAGQLALDAQGNAVGQGDAAAQTRQVFQNLNEVLANVGASFRNVVELTTFVVGRESVQGFIKARTDLYPKLFPDGDYPPNTLAIVNGLVREEFLVEVKAIAALP